MAIDRLRLRLDAALAEQRRLAARQLRAAGTADGRDAAARLRAVTERVAKYERLLAALEPRAGGRPLPR